MKKVFFAVLILVMIIAVFTGCTKNDNAAGGYTKERKVTKEDIAIFNEALGSDSNKYEPIKVATQVVAGTNYKFYVRELSTDKYFYIVVYDSLDENEKPIVSEITVIE